MQQNQEKQATPTSSVWYGTIHFMNCLLQSALSLKLGIRLSVQMERFAISSLPFLCFQQIMKSSITGPLSVWQFNLTYVTGVSWDSLVARMVISPVQYALYPGAWCAQVQWVICALLRIWERSITWLAKWIQPEREKNSSRVIAHGILRYVKFISISGLSVSYNCMW